MEPPFCLLDPWPKRAGKAWGPAVMSGVRDRGWICRDSLRTRQDGFRQLSKARGWLRGREQARGDQLTAIAQAMATSRPPHHPAGSLVQGLAGTRARALKKS